MTVVFFLASAAEAAAQSNSAAPSLGEGEGESDTGRGLWKRIRDRDHLLGDLGGARSWLEERGAALDLVYTAEYFRNTRGGIKIGDRYRGDLSLTLELDTEAAGWWNNGEFFVHLQAEHGSGITDDFVGDFQVLSNIDADDFAQVSEFWYQHNFLDGRLRLKLGKMDATADFIAPGHGGEFIGSTPGFQPTIPLVTYPDGDWGVVLSAEPVDWLTITAGVYQGRPDGGRSIGDSIDNLFGPLVLFEPTFHYSFAGLQGDLRVGGWWLGDQTPEFLKPFEEAAGIIPNEHNSHGWWVTLDQELWNENPDDEKDGQGLAFFAQYGWASEEVSEAKAIWGAGLEWIGPIPNRDDDVLGLGVFYTEFSDEAGFAQGQETAFEFFYKVQLFNWLSIKPDVQFITDPGGAGNKDALAAGVRLELNF